MKKHRIFLGINYPYPIHKMKAYRKFVSLKHNLLPKTEKFAKQIFSLPIYPTLESFKINKIIKIFDKVLSEKNN